jgi:hypothetical protein
MEFISFFVQCLFWYFVIGIVFNFLKQKIDAKADSTELSNILKKLNDIVHRVKVEQHGDMFYWFDADNDEFLGQGKNTEEAIDHVKKRFPNHIFFVTSKEQQYKISGPNWSMEPFNLDESTKNT